MKYHGIVTQSEVNNRYKNRSRFAIYFHHSTMFRGKKVNWYEVIEDTSMKPVIIKSRSTMKQLHIFFTQVF